ncbi:MAG: outer membrane lipoprotein carrier protein LolA [Bdellovibrionales bacterium]|nr:outer membrane lipoprotein carrier protein LolA [Bdellovibrionales bacterium]
MFKYFQALIVIFLAVGCASSKGREGQKKLTATAAAKPSAKELSKPKATLEEKKQPTKDRPDSAVVTLIKKYKSESPVSVKIRKRVQSPYLTKEKVSSGVLKLDKDLFRLDLEKPDASTMVLDGKNIWVETRLDPAMGGEVQVSKFALDDTRRANAVFAVLFDGENGLEGFELKKINQPSVELKEFIYQPKKEAVDYKTVAITISKKGDVLKSFSYEDELENKVIYDFGTTTFKAKIKRWELEYTPPKGVKPSEF